MFDERAARRLVGTPRCGVRSSQRDDPTSSSINPRPVLRRQAGQALRVVSSEIFAPQLAQTLITPITSYLLAGQKKAKNLTAGNILRLIQIRLM
jgi:hypothetical protein